MEQSRLDRRLPINISREQHAGTCAVLTGGTWPLFCQFIFNWLCIRLQEVSDKVSALLEVSPALLLSWFMSEYMLFRSTLSASHL